LESPSGKESSQGYHGAPTGSRNPRILVVDDEIPVRDILVQKLAVQGFHCDCCESGSSALAMLGFCRYDLLLADIERIEMGWNPFLREAETRNPNIAVILLTSEGNLEVAVGSLKGGAYDYIMKPFTLEEVSFSVGRALEKRRLLLLNQEYQRTLEEQVIRRTQELREALDVLQHTYHSTLLALGTALDSRETDNEGHSLRVTLYALRIARQLNMAGRELQVLEQGALLHDIGKLGVPDGLLRKNADLTSDEWEVMKKHPEIGFRILSGISFLVDAAQLVLQHHERYDGTGYPRRLKGDEIQLGARVFAAADVYDAMVTDHPYQAAKSAEQAREAIRGLGGTQLDPRVVEAFLGVETGEWTAIRTTVRDRLRGGFALRSSGDLQTGISIG
jgi:putative nucleotidyltransferase with HDIG domain